MSSTSCFLFCIHRHIRWHGEWSYELHAHDVYTQTTPRRSSNHASPVPRIDKTRPRHLHRWACRRAAEGRVLWEARSTAPPPRARARGSPVPSSFRVSPRPHLGFRRVTSPLQVSPLLSRARDHSRAPTHITSLFPVSPASGHTAAAEVRGYGCYTHLVSSQVSRVTECATVHIRCTPQQRTPNTLGVLPFRYSYSASGARALVT